MDKVMVMTMEVLPMVISTVVTIQETPMEFQMVTKIMVM